MPQMSPVHRLVIRVIVWALGQSVPPPWVPRAKAGVGLYHTWLRVWNSHRALLRPAGSRRWQASKALDRASVSRARGTCVGFQALDQPGNRTCAGSQASGVAMSVRRSAPSVTATASRAAFGHQFGRRFLEPDNGRDHRAGRDKVTIRKRPQARLRCIPWLSALVFCRAKVE